MSKKKHNRYEKKAAKDNFVGHLGQGLPTKHNIKNTLLETGKDLVVGVVGGGLVGAAIGKPSLLIGLGVTGAGHFMDNHLAKLFGIGIMAANGFQKQGVSGLDGMDGVKERMEAYKDNFAEKLYIGHIIPKKDSVNGMGELQFFNYAHDIDELHEMRDELSQELKELDRIEKQIEQSGMAHAQSTGMNLDEMEMEHHDDPSAEQEMHHTHHEEQQADFDLNETNI